ncbi:hydrogenase nickel incorporation protein HypB [Clostridium manihotivorum]|uniref:Hydrogenase accessory protein HypB n=1 Tax=Clostridium manihotivorum TaxID=2320868 RepID=A0A3R5R2N1_9CLOT|nr:hydrogenase nickel incorporation protein HypB [Clostridium manihotivorum]QAA35393.1 hydrogenase accessory protein HypB [Clostridium manihotivorum]
MKNILIEKRILQSNDEFAENNRRRFAENGIFAINIFGSLGAGKTTLLEKTLSLIKDSTSIGVIEGDLYTTKDAERIEQEGINVVQINTCGACHLDASMIEEAVKVMRMDELETRMPKLMFIENVGNLVCPASYDLGENTKITVLSVTEGNDKPLKYPFMFKISDIVVLNKIDLINFTDFDIQEFREDICSLNKNAKIFEVSSRTGEGVEDFAFYLMKLIKNDDKY